MDVHGTMAQWAMELPSETPSSTMQRPKLEPATESGGCDGDDSSHALAMSNSARIDKDFLCPICMEPMKDAFLTACGHSFCYSCITTHLNNRRNCPCCSQFLTHDQIFPNFTLNKLLKKATSNQLGASATPSEHLRLAIQQGTELSVKELDRLLVMLVEKKRKAEQEEAEVNMEILLDFLHRSRHQKQAELDELRADLQYIREDIVTVENRRRELQQEREQAAINMRLLLNAEAATGTGGRPDPGFSKFSSATSMLEGGTGQRGWGSQMKGVGMISGGSGKPPQVVTSGITDAALIAATSLKKKRVLSHFEDLQECYLTRKRQMAVINNERRALMERISSAREGGLPSAQELGGVGGLAGGLALPVGGGLGGETANPLDSSSKAVKGGLEDFQNVLSAFTRFSRLKVIAELRHGDLFHSSNIVSSIEFDRDDEFFATAGVSRRIKIFEYQTVVNEMADVHCPVVELSTRSKLSCLSWNKYSKAQIASSDYEGIVTVWDVNACASVMEYEEHEKRAWSVDFSRTEPTRLVSGSDDGKVKIWCTRQENSTMNLDMKANICCVKFNPGSANYIAVGSADHHIHYFDLRNPIAPLHVFSGHRKAVSYVKFISPTMLASASTDSTLRLWDVQQNSALRTLTGHTNEKNFVGLSVNSDYVACGSESNEVFVYYKEMSKPTAVHRFGSADPLTGEESDDDSSHFISAVCWKSDSPTMLAANSQGTIKVLTMAS